MSVSLCRRLECPKVFKTELMVFTPWLILCIVRILCRSTVQNKFSHLFSILHFVFCWLVPYNLLDVNLGCSVISWIKINPKFSRMVIVRLVYMSLLCQKDKYLNTQRGLHKEMKIGHFTPVSSFLSLFLHLKPLFPSLSHLRVLFPWLFSPQWVHWRKPENKQ